MNIIFNGTWLIVVFWVAIFIVFALIGYLGELLKNNKKEKNNVDMNISLEENFIEDDMINIENKNEEVELSKKETIDDDILDIYNKND